MSTNGSIGLVLTLVTTLISVRAFRRESVFSQYTFAVDRILIHKEYNRLISSGFVHVDWRHLLFNMYALMSFAGTVEQVVGPWKVLFLYFASLIGGNLLSLYIHRNHDAYRAVGASGAVSGVLFATIVLFPSIGVSPLFMPFRIPAWVFGLLYTFVSIYGIKSLNDNVGHDAHLGGALVGTLSICALEPAALLLNWPYVLLLTAPTVVFLAFLIKRPDWLYIQGFSMTKYTPKSVDDRYSEPKFNRQEEIDRILDKIGQKGINSLTTAERKVLEEV